MAHLSVRFGFDGKLKHLLLGISGEFDHASVERSPGVSIHLGASTDWAEAVLLAIDCRKGMGLYILVPGSTERHLALGDALWAHGFFDVRIEKPIQRPADPVFRQWVAERNRMTNHPKVAVGKAYGNG